jgi:hypothetical protein
MGALTQLWAGTAVEAEGISGKVSLITWVVINRLSCDAGLVVSHPLGSYRESCSAGVQRGDSGCAQGVVGGRVEGALTAVEEDRDVVRYGLFYRFYMSNRRLSALGS